MQNRNVEVFKSNRFMNTNINTVIGTNIAPEPSREDYLTEFRLRNDLTELLTEIHIEPRITFSELTSKYSKYSIEDLFKELSYFFERDDIEEFDMIKYIDSSKENPVETVIELINIVELNNRYLKLKENFEIAYEIE